MDSRERVLAAFRFEEPDRPPAWCGASPEFWEAAKAALGLDDEGLRRRLGDDFRRVSAPYLDPEGPPGPGRPYRSPFGVEREGIGYGMPTSHPLANAGKREIEGYPWPDPDRVDLSSLRREAGAWRGGYAILGGDWSPFWHDVIDLVGMERLYILMYDEPELVDALFGRVVGYYAAVNERVVEEAGDLIDILFIGNDFGSQTGPLLGPDLFDRFVAPHLSRIASIGRARGLKVMLHCCGGFRQLIPSMIRSGIDALHALQPDCAGMEAAGLKRDFGRALVLNGGIDSKRFLVQGSPDEVRAETGRVLSILAPGGGYVAGASHDYILPETPLANVLAMFDAIRDYRRP